MDQALSFVRQKESRRLFLLIGATLAILSLLQYFELPSSLSPFLFSFNGKTSSFVESSANSHQPENITHSSGSESNTIGTNITTSFTSQVSTVETDVSGGNKSTEKEGIFGNVQVVESSRGRFSNVSQFDSNSTSFEAEQTDLLIDEYGISGAPPTLSPSVSPTSSTSYQLLPTDTTLNSSAPSLNSDNDNSLPAAKRKRKRKKTKKQIKSKVISISEMNGLLTQGYASPSSARPCWPSEVDRDLLFVKSEIVKAPAINNDTEIYAPVYRNVSMFKRSYELMENTLKVYVYQEGERPIFHEPMLIGIYASEGWFMKQMEANEKFVTKDPQKAHLFYIPFSSRHLELTLYDRKSHSRKNLIQFMTTYVDMLAAKYNFWNRTGGTDHFVAACHDWAPAETRGNLLNGIRALCNSDINLGFRIGKDVSLPETNMRLTESPLQIPEGNPPSQRPFLAFFAGQMHGYVRPILLEYWGNKDDHDMNIFGPMPHVKGNKVYIDYMKRSKFCICPRGFEVNSPRIVESILHECVPVIISDNYVPPVFEVLNWESFSVFVSEKDIPDLKKILRSIPEEKYMEMHYRVKKVKQHFRWHSSPVKYDLFHMILHSVWYNRVFQIRT